MEKKLSNAMCKTLRSCGLPKRETLSILNTVQKWYDSCGVEWTVDRLKDLHHWYITLKAGNPVIPSWSGHHPDNTPKGCFRVVFRLHNTQRALACLSLHTVFESPTILRKQLEKELHGLGGNNLTVVGAGERLASESLHNDLIHDFYGHELWKMCKKYPMTPKVPSFAMLTGNSIPIGKAVVSMQHLSDTSKDIKADIAETYAQSWLTMPSPTVEYLLAIGAEHQLPPVYDKVISFIKEGWSKLDGLPTSSEFGNLVDTEVNSRYQVSPWLGVDNYAGRIGAIQEASLKARWVANPNRVMQNYLDPLAEFWYDVLKHFPSDCTFDQTKGVRWVQSQLQRGVTLSGSDLTSATDLLSLDEGLAMVNGMLFGHFFSRFLRSESELQGYPVSFSTSRLWDHFHVDPGKAQIWGYRYLCAIQHFKRVSRMEWVAPKGIPYETMKWSQGQPLGTRPSFALLGLMNNIMGFLAVERTCRRSGIPFEKELAFDSFRVIGDDIILKAEYAGEYNSLVTMLGGEVNLTKTVTSNRLAEFAGRIIEPNTVSLKRIKFKGLSDNSFIEVVDRLGPQAVTLLRPRQRKAWRTFKYVPGIAVDGPWAQNSYGQPLVDRLIWYDKFVAPGEKLPPDWDSLSKESFLNSVLLGLASSRIHKDSIRKLRICIPRDLDRDFQSPHPSKIERSSGDPRLKHGNTTLKRTEIIRENPGFQPLVPEDKLNTQPTHSKPPVRPQPRKRRATHRNVESPGTPKDPNKKPSEDWDWGR